MKLVIVLPQIAAGGTERAAVELANYLVENSVEVTLLLMFKTTHFFNVNPKVKIIEPSGIRNKIGRTFYIPFLLFFLRRHIINERPDTVFLMGYILFGLIASLQVDSKVVVSWRSSPKRVRFPRNPISNYMYRFFHFILKKRVDSIIAQTIEAKLVYSKKYTCKIAVIPNFLREIELHSNNIKGNIIITVGRCVPEKGQFYLLEAFSKINNRDWKLMILGDGPLKESLEQRAIELGVRKKVEFIGFTQNVDYYLSQASIFAFTSVVEGYPNALIEGMANGLAPISFDCSAGPSDIIEHGVNGFLIKVGDIDSLAKHLSILIGDRDIREKIQLNALRVNDTNQKDIIMNLYSKILFSDVNNKLSFSELIYT